MACEFIAGGGIAKAYIGTSPNDFRYYSGYDSSRMITQLLAETTDGTLYIHDIEFQPYQGYPLLMQWKDSRLGNGQLDDIWTSTIRIRVSPQTTSIIIRCQHSGGVDPDDDGFTLFTRLTNIDYAVISGDRRYDGNEYIIPGSQVYVSSVVVNGNTLPSSEYSRIQVVFEAAGDLIFEGTLEDSRSFQAEIGQENSISLTYTYTGSSVVTFSRGQGVQSATLNNPNYVPPRGQSDPWPFTVNDSIPSCEISGDYFYDRETDILRVYSVTTKSGYSSPFYAEIDGNSTSFNSEYTFQMSPWLSSIIISATKTKNLTASFVRGVGIASATLRRLNSNGVQVTIATISVSNPTVNDISLTVGERLYITDLSLQSGYTTPYRAIIGSDDVEITSGYSFVVTEDATWIQPYATEVAKIGFTFRKMTGISSVKLKQENADGSISELASLSGSLNSQYLSVSAGARVIISEVVPASGYATPYNVTYYYQNGNTMQYFSGTFTLDITESITSIEVDATEIKAYTYTVTIGQGINRLVLRDGVFAYSKTLVTATAAAPIKTFDMTVDPSSTTWIYITSLSTDPRYYSDRIILHRHYTNGTIHTIEYSMSNASSPSFYITETSLYLEFEAVLDPSARTRYFRAQSSISDMSVYYSGSSHGTIGNGAAAIELTIKDATVVDFRNITIAAGYQYPLYFEIYKADGSLWRTYVKTETSDMTFTLDENQISFVVRATEIPTNDITFICRESIASMNLEMYVGTSDTPETVIPLTAGDTVTEAIKKDATIFVRSVTPALWNEYPLKVYNKVDGMPQLYLTATDETKTISFEPTAANNWFRFELTPIPHRTASFKAESSISHMEIYVDGEYKSVIGNGGEAIELTIPDDAVVDFKSIQLSIGYQYPLYFEFYKDDGTLWRTYVKTEGSDMSYSMDANHVKVVVRATKIETNDITFICRDSIASMNLEVYVGTADTPERVIPMKAGESVTEAIKIGATIFVRSVTPAMWYEYPLNVYNKVDGMPQLYLTTMFDTDTLSFKPTETNNWFRFELTPIPHLTASFYAESSIDQLKVYADGVYKTTIGHGALAQEITLREGALISFGDLIIDEDDHDYPITVKLYTSGGSLTKTYVFSHDDNFADFRYELNENTAMVVVSAKEVNKARVNFVLDTNVLSITVDGQVIAHPGKTIYCKENPTITRVVVDSNDVVPEKDYDCVYMSFNREGFDGTVIEHQDFTLADTSTIPAFVTGDEVKPKVSVMVSYRKDKQTITFECTENVAYIVADVYSPNAGDTQSLSISLRAGETETHRMYTDSTVILHSVVTDTWSRYPLDVYVMDGNVVQETPYKTFNEGDYMSFKIGELYDWYRFDLTSIPHQTCYLRLTNTAEYAQINYDHEHLMMLYASDEYTHVDLEPQKLMSVRFVKKKRRYNYPMHVDFFKTSDETTSTDALIFDADSFEQAFEDAVSWTIDANHAVIRMRLVLKLIEQFDWFLDDYKEVEHGHSRIDGENIRTGKPFTLNMLAENWNRLIDKIAEVRDAYNLGTDTSKYKVTSGTVLTAELFNEVKSMIADLEGSGPLVNDVKKDAIVMASHFHGPKSLKASLNTAIIHYDLDG